MKISDRYFDWFTQLLKGTDEYNNKKLISTNDKYSLIQIKYKGFYDRFNSKMKGAFTEWVVAVNGELDNTFYNFPKYKWKKSGRLLKEDKELILKLYNLAI